MMRKIPKQKKQAFQPALVLGRRIELLLRD